eukprot:Opistho-2@23649
MARIMSGAAIALLVVLLATTAKASSESTMLAAVDVTFTDPSFTSSNLTFVIEFEGIFGTFCPIVAFSGLLVPTDPPAACMPINNAPANNATKWIAVVMRSDRNCTFYTKAMNAYNAGATAVLIVNDDPTRVVIMSAQENVPIPVISVSLNSGVKIISLVSQSGNTATAAVSVGAELSLFHLVYSRLFFRRGRLFHYILRGDRPRSRCVLHSPPPPNPSVCTAHQASPRCRQGSGEVAANAAVCQHAAARGRKRRRDMCNLPRRIYCRSGCQGASVRTRVSCRVHLPVATKPLDVPALQAQHSWRAARTDCEWRPGPRGGAAGIPGVGCACAGGA